MADMRDKGPNGNWFEQAEAELRQEEEHLEGLYRQQFGQSVEDGMPDQSDWLRDTAHRTVDIKRSVTQAAINAARAMNSREGERILRRLQTDLSMRDEPAQVIHVDFTKQEK